MVPLTGVYVARQAVCPSRIETLHRDGELIDIILKLEGTHMARPNSTGLFGKSLCEILLHSNIDVIYDIGANQGSWTSKYKEKFPGVSFHMFEADPGLKDPRNGGAWHNIALGKLDGQTSTFYSTPYFNGAGNSFYKENSGLFEANGIATSLAQVTLDSYVMSRHLRLPDVIKIDTQGSELDILSGGRRCLANAMLVQLELPIVDYNSGSPRLPECVDFMKGESYLPIGIEEIHIMRNILVQLDVVFAKREILGSLLKPVNPVPWAINV